MLVTSKKRYLPTTINTLVLIKNDYFFYIHRDVYDKAIMLTDRYTLDELVENIQPQNNLSAINYYYENSPSPINILAPFLGLVDKGLPNDIETLTGAIHVITAAIDVKAYTLIESDLRKTLEFSLYIKEEYEMAWERFFMTSIPYDERNTIANTQQQMIDTQTLAAATIENEDMNPLPDSTIEEEFVPIELDDYGKAAEKDKLRSILQIDENM
ncbi:hypothetical protein SH1V18_11330 [Vallitalea longa]|uniref:Uncharacterized protein n=1 Tax=Vallitalea longa TaxID=2936439 RepID=A0A9W6DEP3_9FIRM|nr:hypothetical protein [Vallitalea longa]GKX28653.1 hypothetical protein SH1V18_11330 [Vallitalea longa]